MDMSGRRHLVTGAPWVHQSTTKDQVMTAVAASLSSGLARRWMRSVVEIDSVLVESLQVVSVAPAIVQVIAVAVPSFITWNTQLSLLLAGVLMRTFRFLNVPVPVMIGDKMACAGLATVAEALAVLPAVPM